MVHNLTERQKKLVAREIKKEILKNNRKPFRNRMSRRQAVAIGFGKARRIDPDIPKEENPVIEHPEKFKD